MLQVSLCPDQLSSVMVLFCFLCSGFTDLFDWQHFMEKLKEDIHIVEALPPEYVGIEPFNKTPISWSKVVKPSYCLEI